MNIWRVSLVALLCITCVTCISEEMQELANMLHKQCQEETGVPEDHIVNARKGNFADDNTLKCYMKCLFSNMAVVDDDDGTIDEDGLIGLMPDEYKAEATIVVKKCGTKKGTDPCDTVFQTNKCYQAEAPVNYYLP